MASATSKGRPPAATDFWLPSGRVMAKLLIVLKKRDVEGAAGESFPPVGSSTSI